jgi:hypothetical protein
MAQRFDDSYVAGSNPTVGAGSSEPRSRVAAGVAHEGTLAAKSLVRHRSKFAVLSEVIVTVAGSR